MILTESAAHPGLAGLAQSAYDQLTTDGQIDYHVLSEMIEEASGKGVLRAINQKYGPAARDAIFGPVLREIDRQKPVPPRGWVLFLADGSARQAAGAASPFRMFIVAGSRRTFAVAMLSSRWLRLEVPGISRVPGS
jgi:hypothetical protein